MKKSATWRQRVKAIAGAVMTLPETVKAFENQLMGADSAIDGFKEDVQDLERLVEDKLGRDDEDFTKVQDMLEDHERAIDTIKEEAEDLKALDKRLNTLDSDLDDVRDDTTDRLDRLYKAMDQVYGHRGWRQNDRSEPTTTDAAARVNQ